MTTNTFDAAAFEGEARDRWGGMDAWRIASERAKAYGPAGLAKAKQELDAVSAALARLMAAGRAPGHAAVQAQVEAWRRLIERWFYPCDDAQIARLADLYEADERYRASFDAHAPGLGRFVVAAFRHGRA